MNPKRLLALGLAGTGITAVCCFTPALVLLFGALGLSAALAWADYVLLPALVLFAAVSLVAMSRLRTAVARGDAS